MPFTKSTAECFRYYSLNSPKKAIYDINVYMRFVKLKPNLTDSFKTKSNKPFSYIHGKSVSHKFELRSLITYRNLVLHTKPKKKAAR